MSIRGAAIIVCMAVATLCLAASDEQEEEDAVARVNGHAITADDVEQFMSLDPYRKAQRVFLIVDNGSAHRGTRSVERLQGAWPNLIVVHTPVHASWLNQTEIYFSVVQRKVVQPNDFADLAVLEERLLAFGRRYEQIAAPFQWTFTRQHLHELTAKADTAAPHRIAA